MFNKRYQLGLLGVLSLIIAFSAILTTYIILNKKEVIDAKPLDFEPIPEPVPNQLVLQFSEKASKEEIDSYIKSIDGEIVNKIDSLNTVTISVSSKTASNPLPENKNLKLSEPNYFISALQYNVNDPDFNKQWGIPVIDVENAWEANANSSDFKIVAVVDSGVCLDHPDLRNKFMEGYDFIENDETPQDDMGHGCGIAGIIGANINNSQGIAGIASNVKIMPVRVLDSAGVGTYANVAAGIAYAVDNGADIINLSLGGINPSEILENAINYAIDNGVTVVAASGNTGKDGVLYPAKYSNVIAVGSVNRNLERSSFSTYGTEIDILAPGEEIYTTLKDGSYGYVSGTSYAAPVVSAMLTHKDASEFMWDGKVIGWGGNVENAIGESEEGEIPEGEVEAQGDVIFDGNDKSHLFWPFPNSTYQNTKDGWWYDKDDSTRHDGSDKESQDWNYKGGNADEGLSVYAPFDGKVIFVKNDWGSSDGEGYGNHIVIQSTQNPSFAIRFAHMKEVTIGYGTVKGGQLVGTIGNTGFVDYHLHVSLYKNLSNQAISNLKIGGRPGGEDFAADFEFDAVIHNCKNFSDNVPVTVYKDYECQGEKASYVGGSSQTYASSSFNDQISSIKIKPGWSVFVYQGYFNDSNNGGRRCITESFWDLRKDYFTEGNTIQNIDNQISSLQVFNDSTCGGKLQCAQQLESDLSAGGMCSGGGGSSGGGSGTAQGDSADFIADLNIPDNTTVQPNASFNKTWKIQNNGTTTWGSGYKLKYQYGTKMGSTTEVNLPYSVAPGQFVDVSVPMVTPNSAGTYRGTWSMVRPNGSAFGDVVWVQIKVNSSAPAQPVGGTGQVKLYALANYSQFLKGYGVGEYDNVGATSKAMELPDGWSVITYRSNGFQNDPKCWYESVHNLEDYSNWQFAIRSMKVYNYNACGGGQKVKLFREINYQNEIGSYDPGKTDHPSRNAYSMEIPAGWSVKTYTEDGGHGRDECWNSSQKNLQDHDDWQNNIASMEVFTTDQCPSNNSWVKICRETGWYGDHEGSCITVDESIPDLGSFGFGDNVLKASNIQGDWEAIIYEHGGYQGKSFKLPGGQSNDLGGNPMGYGASSIEVRKKSPELVTLYALNDYNGEAFKSDRTLENIDRWGFNDKAQSIRVAEGYEVILCQHAYFRGICGRTKGNHVDVNEVAYPLWKDVSSIRVCKDSCPPSPIIPVLSYPEEGSSFLPNTNINFVWNSDGPEYGIEIWGGEYIEVRNLWKLENSFSLKDIPVSKKPYYWRVRGWNGSGESNPSKTRTFYVKDIPVDKVNVVGNNEVGLNEEVTLKGFMEPLDASNITYTWSPEPLEGQGTKVAKYKWDNPGEHNVRFSAKNSNGGVYKDFKVNIKCTNGDFSVEYFNGKNLQGEPVSKECKSEITYNWEDKGPMYTASKETNLGTGADGDLVINENEVFITDKVKYSVSSINANQNQICLPSSSGFNVNDEVLIIQSKGQSAGLYEFKRISSLNGNCLLLFNNLQNSYFTGAQVIRVPNYNNLTIKGKLTASNWNGTTGGVLAVRVANKLTIEGGEIDMSNKGYRGGVRTYSSKTTGLQGEGWNSDGTRTTAAGAFGNGGGGHGTGDGGAGGGGGAYRTNGYDAKDPFYGDPGKGAISIYGDNLLTKLYFGGGGGAGGTDDSAQDNIKYGGAGGNGGGIIFVETKEINGIGKLQSNGGNGENNGHEEQGGGAGGAGGSIKVLADRLNIANIDIYSEGGYGARSKDGNGGNGGEGYFYTQYCENMGQSILPETSQKKECQKDNFSARFTQVKFFEKGTYKISAKVDDGIRVWFGEELVIDKWDEGLKDINTYKYLEGKEYLIKVEYFDATGSAEINLNLEKISSTQNIPPEVSSIQGQEILQLHNFEKIDLNKLVLSEGSGGLKWSVEGNEKIKVIIEENNIATLSFPRDWSGSETIKFTVTDSNNESDSSEAIFKVNSYECSVDKLNMQLFDNIDLQGESLYSNCIDEINFNWGNLAPENERYINKGTGKDGDLVIPAGQTKVIDTIKSNVYGSLTKDTTEICLYNRNGFNAGDEILIIKSRGTDVGNYEYKTIKSLTPCGIALDSGLKNNYSGSSVTAQIIKVFHYKNLTVDGTLTVSPWNGFEGGIMAFRVSENLVVNGRIDVDGKGYGGGYPNNTNDYSGSGEGITGLRQQYISANDLGGGGALQTSEGGPGGGGGGNRTPGSKGKEGGYVGRSPGEGGISIDNNNFNQIYMGGGGGAGARAYSTPGGNGGNGGGIILINAGKATVNGNIGANGNKGENGKSGTYQPEAQYGNSGGGGGGAGGTIILNAEIINANDTKVTANGGNAGSKSGGNAGAGGAGGMGFTQFRYCNEINGDIGSDIFLEKTICNVGNDNFGVKIEGVKYFDQGDYKFKVNVDDGIRVWVDDQLIIDQWNNGSKEIVLLQKLEEGYHSLKIEYFEATGDAQIELEIVEYTNTPPVVSNIPNQTVKNNEPFEKFDLDDYVFDANESDEIKWTYAGNKDLEVNINSENVVEIKYPEGWFGEEKIKFTAKDIGLEEDFKEVIFKSEYVNKAPVITSEPVATVKAGEIYIYDVDAQDFETDLVYSLNKTVEGMTIDSQTGKITWQTTLGTTGNFLIEVKVSDGTLESIQSFNINIIQAPCVNEYCVSYYNNRDLSGEPAYTSTDSSIDKNWGSGSPQESVLSDNFSARWMGKFYLSGKYSFISNTDDGVRVWVDNNLIIDKWTDNVGNGIYSNMLDLQEGFHEIKFEYYELTGNASAKLEIAESFKGNGCISKDKFCVSFYNNLNLKNTPVFQQIENVINNNWRKASPVDSVNKDKFSVRWVGNINFSSGKTTFKTITDDGVRLWIDGKLIINQWKDLGKVQHSAAINLTQGYHEVRMEYVEKSGNALAKLSW